MYTGRTVFSQIMDVFPLKEFRCCVERYSGDYKVQSFSCLDQFLTLAFAQLSYRESLRDIEACLRAMQPRLYHMGFRGGVSRNNLAHANEKRNWRIYADLAQFLIAQARPLYAQEPFGVELKDAVYALDSTTIDLCLSLFPWAPWTHNKAAVKLHTVLDLRGSIPTVIEITPARVSDNSMLDRITPESGAFYIMDRGYIHAARLYQLTVAAAFLSCGRAKICCSAAAPHSRSIRALDCGLTRRSPSPGSSPLLTTPCLPDAFVTSTRNSSEASSF